MFSFDSLEVNKMLEFMKESAAYPIVYKGSVVNNILVNNLLQRRTEDFDGDYLKREHTDEQVLEIIRSIANNIGLNVEMIRETGFNRTSKFEFYDYSHERLFTFDLGREKKPYIVIDGIKVQKYEKTINDKLNVVLSEKVERRIKDFYDLYILISVLKMDIRDIAFNGNKLFGGKSKDLIEDSYFRFARSNNIRVLFDEMYHVIRAFLQPIESGVTSGLMWDTTVWLPIEEDYSTLPIQVRVGVFSRSELNVDLLTEMKNLSKEEPPVALDDSNSIIVIVSESAKDGLCEAVVEESAIQSNILFQKLRGENYYSTALYRVGLDRISTNILSWDKLSMTWKIPIKKLLLIPMEEIEKEKIRPKLYSYSRISRDNYKINEPEAEGFFVPKI